MNMFDAMNMLDGISDMDRQKSAFQRQAEEAWRAMQASEEAYRRNQINPGPFAFDEGKRPAKTETKQTQNKILLLLEV